MQDLRQSTAGQEIRLPQFVDDTDGKTPETGLTIANTDIKLLKHGATAEVNKNSGGATHLASGRYYTVLDATDTDVVGMLAVSVLVAGALHVERHFNVLSQAQYDFKYGSVAPASSTALATVDGIVDAILEDTSTTLPDSLATLASALVTIDGIVDAIVEDTGTTLPATLATIDGIVDSILAALAVVDGIVDSILEDTGTTLPAAIPSAAAVTTAVLAGAASTPIAASIKSIVATGVQGAGVVGNKWRPA